MVRLCAFLGNAGREYASNRHNVAWLFLDASGIGSGLSWRRAHQGRVASLEGPGERVFLLKPETFMNLSGKSLGSVARKEGLKPDEILVLHDELELPFGFVSLKRGGGLGGHNGLRSAADCLGTRDFLRMRFGIGRPAHDDIAGYVLSDFTRDERNLLDERIFPAAAEILRSVLAEGFDAVEPRARKLNALAGI
jgi:peptidyl-tRNA hydrolase, PTH1 family